MNESIAVGIHTVLDWECQWDQEAFTGLLEEYKITPEMLHDGEKIDSMRALLAAVVYYMQKGIGVELFPDNNQIVQEFAAPFTHLTTIGGTGARAAIAVAKLGIPCVLQISSDNEAIRSLMPANIRLVPAGDRQSSTIYPHISLTYPGGVRIRTESLDYVTPRENRIMVCYDPESAEMPVRETFSQDCPNAKVLLLSSFCGIQGKKTMTDRLNSCIRMLQSFPPETLVIMEDAVYAEKELQVYTHQVLQPYLDVLGMNEDELHEVIHREININCPEQVVNAIEEAYQTLGIPTLFVHSSRWVIAYGKDHSRYREALQAGINMASTRFCHGDQYGPDEYKAVSAIPPMAENVQLAEQLESLSPMLTAVPCKDLSFVSHPTVVGLGDSFAGGILPPLAR